MDNRLACHAEQSLIGCLLLDIRAWERVTDILIAADFGDPAHRLIWEVIDARATKGQPVDPFLVAAQLERDGTLAELPNGMQYMGHLLDTTPSAANARFYAERIREQSILRQLVSASAEIGEDAQSGEGEPAAILENAAQKIGAIADQSQRGQGALSMREIMRDMIGHLDAVMTSGGKLLGLPTGYADLDKKTSGLQPGDLVILAGRPSMGKSCLAVNIAEHVAIRERKPVMIFSLEMPSRQLGLRMTASQARLDFNSLRHADLDESEWRKLTAVTSQIQDAPLRIDDAAGLTLGDIAARARRAHRELGGLGLIVVDYLQLITTRGKVENRNIEISKVSQGLKAIAKSLGCPVVALSQLSRGVEQRADKRPLMSDLRDSGGIEQDADLIAFIYRDEVYHEDSSDKGTAEIIIAKQRNGETGTVRLAFRGDLMRFDSLAPGWQPQFRQAEPAPVRAGGRKKIYDY